MSMMLASVRDLGEARMAYAGGVDWLDVKDPHAGALGRADAACVRDIVAFADGRVPVSATIGDCWDTPAIIPPRVEAMAATGVGHVKVGLDAREVTAALLAMVRHCTAVPCAVIVVCLAERPPRVQDIEALASSGIAGIMLDTANKAGRSLTALLAPAELQEFVATARRLRLLSGLAGRLRLADVPSLLPLAPDYLGFRGALCRDGRREAALSRAAIARVKAAMTAGAHDQNLSNEVA